MPKLKMKRGKVKHFSYTAKGQAAYKKAKSKQKRKR